MSKKYLLIAGALLIISLQACFSTSDTCSVVTDVDARGWHSGKLYTLGYVNNDTTSLKQLSVFMRLDRDVALEVDSILLTVTTHSPDSLVYGEQWLFYPNSLKNENGQIFTEVKQVYRTSVKLKRVGEYRFAFTHGYQEPLLGVRSIGVEIEDL